MLLRVHRRCSEFLHLNTPAGGYVSQVNNPALTGLTIDEKTRKPVMLLTFSAVITFPASAEVPEQVLEQVDQLSRDGGDVKFYD